MLPGSSPGRSLDLCAAEGIDWFRRKKMTRFHIIRRIADKTS